MHRKQTTDISKGMFDYFSCNFLLLYSHMLLWVLLLKVWWSSFSSLLLFSTFCLSLISVPCLSLFPAHSCLRPLSPIPSPHTDVYAPCLCPLDGFVLLPQCQGPGGEVTHHRRAAGLTEPPPSPPPSSAQTANMPAVFTSPRLSRLWFRSRQLHLNAYTNH